jgi:phenylalanyl-tRNA synthetase alpha chain
MDAPLTLAPMIDDVDRARADASARISAAATLDELRSLDTELLGKRGALATLKQRLATLDPADRPTAGQALNRALAELRHELEQRRAALAAHDRRTRLAAERLDPPSSPANRSGATPTS